MNTAIKTNSNVKSEVGSGVETVSKVSIGVMGFVSLLVGVWAVACLVGALVSTGPAGVIAGFFSAILG